MRVVNGTTITSGHAGATRARGHRVEAGISQMGCSGHFSGGNMKPILVSYLGPKGTFSNKVAAQRFGARSRYLPLPAIAEVFDSVNTGQADYGVVPIENSSGGTVYDTVDELVNPDF